MAKEKQSDLMTIGEKLRKLRIEANYTSYRRFADENDIEPKQYWKLEEDKVDARISSLRRIIEIYGLTFEEFFKGVG